MTQFPLPRRCSRCDLFLFRDASHAHHFGLVWQPFVHRDCLGVGPADCLCPGCAGADTVFGSAREVLRELVDRTFKADVDSDGLVNEELARVTYQDYQVVGNIVAVGRLHHVGTVTLKQSWVAMGYKYPLAAAAGR